MTDTSKRPDADNRKESGPVDLRSSTSGYSRELVDRNET